MKLRNFIFLFFCLIFSCQLCASRLYPTGYLPLEIENLTEKLDKSIYIVIKATDISTNRDCFININMSTGVGSCELVYPGIDTKKFNYRLSKLPLSNNQKRRMILIPKTISGRVYFSIGYPMDLFVSPISGRILDPDGFKRRDSNYYTLYDKIEYSYNSGGSWVNPTAVDFFSLPIHIKQSGSTNGIIEAGLSNKRASIIKSIKNIIQTNDTTNNKIWNKLFISYSENGKSITLRISSPGKAMIDNLPDAQPFDRDYLSNPDSYGFDYVNYIWQYYTANTLIVDAREIAIFFPLDNYIFVGKVTGNHFIFTNQTGSYSVILDKPNHSTPFFSGSGDAFDAVNNTPKAIIVRQLTAAFDVGLLPTKTGTIIDKNYFSLMKSMFYKINPLLPKVAQGPWYDLYSKSLHGFDGNQVIYSFAYDDSLGQDGTLHDPFESNVSPIEITLESLKGVFIPNPYLDTTIYTVTPIIGSGSIVEYNGAIIQDNAPITNVKIPFHVKLNGQDAYIYFKPPIVRPYFDGADGIVINRDSNSTAVVTFPGK